MNKLARILQNNLDITMDLWYDNCVHISYIRRDVLLLAKSSCGRMPLLLAYSEGQRGETDPDLRCTVKQFIMEEKL